MSKETNPMRTNPIEKEGFLHRLTRLPKILILAGLAAVLALPQADARPGRGRDRDHHRHGYHHHDRHHHHRGYHHHRPAPRPVYRGWSRPGWSGYYPPAGYVDYRYISALPRGYRTVYRNGHRYYYANGCYWSPARYRGNGVYISVRF